MILSAPALRLKREARGDFQGRHFEASPLVQALPWYLRYALSYRYIEEILLKRGLEVDHSTINRWVLAFAPASSSAYGVSADRSAARCAWTRLISRSGASGRISTGSLCRMG